jgi:hypothetical protein
MHWWQLLCQTRTNPATTTGQPGVKAQITANSSPLMQTATVFAIRRYLLINWETLQPLWGPLLAQVAVA